MRAMGCRALGGAVAGLMFVAVLGLALSASAVPLSVSHVDEPTCDPLSVPPEVHELGNGVVSGHAGAPFPPDEEITSSTTDVTTVPACPTSDTGALSVVVSMSNLTPTNWVEVWYVSDPEVGLSNVDGLIEGEEAFRIDFVGLNKPLVFESLTPDGIFEAGETWEFIIDDYSDTEGGFPSDLVSIGVGTSSAGQGGSSGSIIAIAASEPEAAPALPPWMLGLLALLLLVGVTVARLRAQHAHRRATA